MPEAGLGWDFFGVEVVKSTTRGAGWSKETKSVGSRS